MSKAVVGLPLEKVSSEDTLTENPPRNGFVRVARKVYNPMGFKKGYNFTFFVIFAGALLGFGLARFEYLNFNGIYCSPTASPGAGAGPGECYWYKTIRHEHIGIILHLAAILPASILAVFQFVPAIRRRAILYHRMAGYVILTLIPAADAGALMVTAHAFGGDNSVRAWSGLLVISTTVCLVQAYVSIKRLQIDQHRAWMLRAWFIFGSIITVRLIMVIAARVVTVIPGAARHVAMPCGQIISLYKGSTEIAYARYPSCANATMGGFAVVEGLLGDGDLVTAAAALQSSFGMAGWLALFIHIVGVEIYLRLTPAETERLRVVSLERQMARGKLCSGPS